MTITQWHDAGQTATAFLVAALAITVVRQWRADTRRDRARAARRAR